MVFANGMLVWVKMAAIGTPAIRVKAGDPKRCKQRLQLEERLIFASPEHVGQDLAGAVIQRVPEPARRFFLTDKGSHFVDFCRLHSGQPYVRVGAR